MRKIYFLVMFFVLLNFISACDVCFAPDSLSTDLKTNSCQLVEINPQQVQNFFNNILIPGFRGNSFYTGKIVPQNTNKNKEKTKDDKTPPKEINFVNKKQGVGLKVNLPSAKAEPTQTNFELKEACSGDFAFAYVLNSTYRIGRCKDENNCALNTNGLFYRNDGDGIKIIKKALLDLAPDTVGKVKDKVVSEVAKSANMTMDKFKKNVDLSLLNKFIDDDLNDIEVQRAMREKMKDALPNSMETDYFEGEFQSACSGLTASRRCQVVLLSYFDKYYNAYYSGIMTATTFGPMVIGISKKALGAAGEFTPVSKLNEAMNKFLKLDKKVDALKELKYAILNKDLKVMSKNMKGLLKELELAGEKPDFIKKLLKDGTKGFKDVAEVLEKDPKKAEILYNFLIKRKELVERMKYAIKDPYELKAFIKDAGDFKDAFGYDVVEEIIKKEKLGVKVKLKGETKDIKDLVKKIYDEDDLVNKINDAKKEYKKLVDAKKIELKNSNPNLTDNQIEKIAKSEALEELDKKGKWYFYKEDPLGGKKITDIEPDKEVLEKIFNKAEDEKKKIVAIVDGKAIEVTKTNIDDIIKKAGAQEIEIRYMGSKIPTDYDLEKFKKTLESKFGKQLDNILEKNTEVITSLKARGLLPKKYVNAVNYFIYREKNKTNFFNKLLNNPVSQFTIYPLLAWKVKTSGFLDNRFQVYFINEGSYDSAKFYPGESRIYDDAYVDIFVNAKMHNGDFFAGVIKNFVTAVTSVLLTKNTEAGFREFMRENFNFLLRDDVQDVIYYMSTDNKCDNGCYASYRVLDNGFANVAAITSTATKNYFLELPDGETYFYNGLNLAVFVHHLNIDLDVPHSKVKRVIDIQKALNMQETCVDKVKNMSIGAIDYFVSKPTRVGAAIGILDNYSWYILSLVPGINVGVAGSIVASYFIADYAQRNFKGCVDSEQGYYLQFTQKPKSKETKHSLDQLISSGKQKFTAKETNKFHQAMNEVKEKLNDVVSTKGKEFLQIYVETQGKSNLNIESKGIFLAWLAGGAYCNVNELDDKSKTIVKSGKDSLIIDKENSELKLNNKLIMKNPLIRFISRNYRVGGFEIPHSAIFVPLGNGDLIKINASGHVKILNTEMLNCIKDGLKKDIDADLTKEFGLFKSAKTTTNQILLQNYNLVVLGTGRDKYSEIIIKDGAKTYAGNKYLGNVLGIVMENGIMIYDAKKHGFWVILKVLAEISSNEVKGFKASIKKLKNDITNCDEYAVDLKVMGNPYDAMAKKKAENMNLALKKVGPFQYFETPKNIFIFYSKLIDGECRSFMKIIDKTTGKVLVDKEITDVESTAQGFRVLTKDGKVHDFKFTNENGKPVLEYNGHKDLLLLAQGKNGSFYFDPNSSKWYVANSHIIPLDDRFRTQGEINAANYARPGENPIYKAPEYAGKEGTFDIPLITEKEQPLFVFVTLLLALFIYYRRVN